MAVKIKLKRMGKIRTPQYRIIIADARTRRDGRAIEEIGKYHPKEDPSLIQIDSERAQYWLGVGAQPTEPVLKLLQITGDWQKFKGLPGADGRLRVKESKTSKSELFNAALAEVHGESREEATTPKKRAAKKSAKKTAAKQADGDTDAKQAPADDAEAASKKPTKKAAAKAESKAPAETAAGSDKPADEAAESSSES